MTKDVPKFYEPSFHQQHDLAMHAKQWFYSDVAIDPCKTIVIVLRCYFLAGLMYSADWTHGLDSRTGTKQETGHHPQKFSLQKTILLIAYIYRIYIGSQ